MLDYVGELVDFEGAVVEEGFALGDCEGLAGGSWSCVLDRRGRRAKGGRGEDARCASFSSFAIVPEMPRPISAARRANSDRRGFSAVAGALSAFWALLSSDCRCAPILFVWRCFWTCVRTEWNSDVRSCMEVETAMVAGEVR